LVESHEQLPELWANPSTAPPCIGIAAKCSWMTPFSAKPRAEVRQTLLRVMTVLLKKPHTIPAPINTMAADEPVRNLHHLDKVHLFATRS